MSYASNTPEQAIRDTQDKPVAFANPCAARAAITAIDDAIGFKLDLRDTGETFHLVPDSRFDQKPLTVPERAIVAAFATHFEQYSLGMKRGAVVHFPTVITAPGRDGEDIGEIAFPSEARAYQFADVAANVFDLDAEVIEAPTGEHWMVAVSHPAGISGEVLEQLRGVCTIFDDYRVERANDAQDDGGNQEMPHRRESSQRAILARLDAIMERLPVATPKGRGIEALIPTADKPAKKSSAKRGA